MCPCSIKFAATPRDPDKLAVNSISMPQVTAIMQVKTEKSAARGGLRLAANSPELIE